MLSAILRVLGDPAELRSIVAVTLATLATILAPHSLSVVTAVVDGVAGLIVAIDVAGHHATAVAETHAATQLSVAQGAKTTAEAAAATSQMVSHLTSILGPSTPTPAPPSSPPAH